MSSDRRPDVLRGWGWDALAILGLVTVITSSAGGAPALVRWSVEHDLRWLGWVVLVGTVAYLVTGLGLAVWLTWHLVRGDLTGSRPADHARPGVESRGGGRP